MIRTQRNVFWLTITVWMILCGSLWATTESPGLKKLTFLPQWLPQAQFAGYYVALNKGYYRHHGIDLTIIPGGPDHSPAAYIKEKKADIVTLWLSSALQLADQSVEVVNVGQIIQRSALVLAAKKSSGINSPADMDGKKIALWPSDFQIQPRAFFDKFDLKVQVVTTNSPINLFLRDGVQVSSLMWYNEYHTLINSGLDPDEITLFFFDDVNLNFPEDGIYLRKETFENDPEAACAFVNASVEGWQYAFAHPEEAIDIMIPIMEAAHIPANRVHQRWMLDRMRDLTVSGPKGERMWELKVDDYRKVGDILVSNGLIRAVPPYELFSRKCFCHDKE
ncbi:MAG: ABC transporter substrate-binding protein [Proteobacteria bacterium]|nr:ABC transporter substrate-binding protein [Pseudomonadota bacterium]